MDLNNKLESIVELYFNKKYKLYKPKDANGEEINKWFAFKSRADFLDAYLNYYKNLPDLKSAIIDGCSAKFKIFFEGQKYELKHNHQEEFTDEQGKTRGVDSGKLSDMAAKLLQQQDNIKTALSFDDVYQVVQSSKIPGFGELSIYDASVRISAYLGFKPTVVFLHAGTKEGAKYLEDKQLLPKDSTLKFTLPVDDFPKPIQKLEALQIENFLCSFKKSLEKI